MTVVEQQIDLAATDGGIPNPLRQVEALVEKRNRAIHAKQVRRLVLQCCHRQVALFLSLFVPTGAPYPVWTGKGDPEAEQDVIVRPMIRSASTCR